MPEHPIENLMKTAMESIKDMIDVNTVVGDPIETPDGYVIVPVSKVSAGFAAGGSEFDTEKDTLPFGGGSGAGVSVQPVGFLIAGKEQVKFLPVGDGNAVIDKIIDVTPKVLENIQQLMGKEAKNKNNGSQSVRSKIVLRPQDSNN